jgi:hypothetical protein
MNLPPELPRPIGIRHNMSGVWLGMLIGPGIMDHMIEIEGRRIWSWEGARLEFSELCQTGCNPRDRLGVWTRQQIPIGVGDGLVELTFQVDRSIIEALKKL